MSVQLKTIVERLEPYVDSIELKCTGDSSFIYAIANSKSVEISIDNGKYWVEYWADLDEDSSAASEMTFNTYEDLEQSVKSWLK